MKVQWDSAKASTNLAKHGVTFEEAVTALCDPLAATIPDPDHSVEEQRYLTVGYSAAGRLLVVSHTDSGTIVRVISARTATATERYRHEAAP